MLSIGSFFEPIKLITNHFCLKNTFERVLPYFNKYIHPRLSNGESILITAHGNSLRSLVKHLEEISEEKIVKLEIATGEPIFYEFINGKVQKIVR